MSDIIRTHSARAAADVELGLRKHFEATRATFDVAQNGDGAAPYTYTVTTDVIDPPTLDRFRDFAAGFLAGRPTNQTAACPTCLGSGQANLGTKRHRRFVRTQTVTSEGKARKMTAQVNFTTNLDEAKPYVWKLTETWRGPAPNIGHSIMFNFDRLDHKRGVLVTLDFWLTVVGVRWSTAGEPTVELHAPHHFASIQKWTDYFRRHVKGEVT
jgi:hypothetical protein